MIISTPNYDFNYWFHNDLTENKQPEEAKTNEKWLNICNAMLYDRPFRHLDHKFEFT